MCALQEPHGRCRESGDLGELFLGHSPRAAVLAEVGAQPKMQRKFIHGGPKKPENRKVLYSERTTNERGWGMVRSRIEGGGVRLTIASICSSRFCQGAPTCGMLVGGHSATEGDAA